MAIPSLAAQKQGQASVTADNLNTFIQGCTTFAQLRAFIGLPNMQVYAAGGVALGDGLQGQFIWNGTTTAADNGISIIKPSGAGSMGAWVRISFSIVIPGLIILTPSGGDDGPILTGLTEPVLLTGGTFQIQSTTTVPVPAIVVPDTLINIATGKTITFNHGFTATIGPVFTNALAGEGTVTFNPAFIDVGYPEWWGAVTNSPTTNCGPPIQAAVAALPITQMQLGGYYCQSTITISTNGRVLRGIGDTQLCAATGTAGGPGTGAVDPHATQIVLTSPSAIGIVVGTLQQADPGTPFVQNVDLKSFTVVRATAAFPLGVSGAAPIDNPASGSSLFGGPALPCGIVWCWVDLCRTSDVMCIEHSAGFYLYGCVESYWDHCSALRYTPGQNSSNDNFSGFYLDYSAPLTGDNAGNASVYIDYCRAFSNCPTQTYTYAAGLTTNQGFVDLFIFKFESGVIQYGIDCQGSGNTGPAFNSEDLHLTECYLDSASIVTMRIQNAGNFSNIEINGGYLNSINGTCLLLSTIGGMVSVSGVGAIDTTTSTGLSIDNVNQISCVGNTWDNFAQPITITNMSESEIRDVIHRVTGSSTFPAITAVGITRSLIACSVGGPANSYTVGVFIDSTSTFNDIYCTKLEPITIGGAGNKIVFNGSPWGGGGTFGTGNIATGVLG
jgi:hypothetical protein